MVEHKLLEMFSLTEAQGVARKDAPSQSTKVGAYVEKNTLTYYVLLNTWSLVWKNFSRHTAIRHKANILSKGLIPVIQECQAEATRIINEEPLSPLGKALYNDLKTTVPDVDHILISNGDISWDDDAKALFLLRYPKRFSPSGNDITSDETIKDFLKYEHRTRMLQRNCSYSYSYISRMVREEIQDMYDWDTICQKIDKIDPVCIPMTTGAAADAKAATGYKLEAILSSGAHEDYFMPIFGMWTLPRPAQTVARPSTAVIRAVPKSYKSSRIIAMDDSYNLAYSQEIERIFRLHDTIDHSGICLEDQSINQKLANLGSIYGTIATLDASHASDLISRSLLVDVFPSAYVHRVLPLLPKNILIPEKFGKYASQAGGRIRPLEMASTSGHTLTFRHETIVYKAIVSCAVKVYESLTRHKPEFYIAHAYGDDSIISAEAAEVAIHFFSRLGLIINEDKSYWNGPFRESCGKDYLNGIDVTSIYYPRFPVVGNIKGDKVTLYSTTYRDTYRGKIDNSLTMLIDLQKKLFPYSYDAAQFVASIVKQAHPKMTFSSAGEVCTDMWDYAAFGRRRKIPHVLPLSSSDSSELHTAVSLFYDHLSQKEFRTNRSNIIGRPFYLDIDGVPMMNGEERSTFFRLADLDALHCVPRVVSKSSTRNFSKSQVALYNWWKYYNFLKYGPRYDDELLRLLNISSDVQSIQSFFGEAALTIALK